MTDTRHPAQFPVQFERVTFGFVPGLVLSACTFCGSYVDDEDLHRGWHDGQDAEHARILRQAQAHVPPPLIGGPS